MFTPFTFRVERQPGVGDMKWFFHQLLGMHFYTPWYYWGDERKRRHCSVCVYTHNGITPYQTAKGYVPQKGEAHE